MEKDGKNKLLLGTKMIITAIIIVEYLVPPS
jgi:hypothetical protein